MSKFANMTCNACKTEGRIEQKKVSKFSGPVVFIGWIFLIPSLLGVLFSLIMFLSMGAVHSDVAAQATSDAEQAGAAIGAGIGYMVFGVLGISSFVGGLLGWLLVMKRKVLKCSNCGTIAGETA